MTNKGDAARPKIRCRYVATEVNHQDDVAFYASTPPLEAIRLLVSQMAKRRTFKGKPLVLSVADATKAYFNAVPQRDLFCSNAARDGPTRWDSGQTHQMCAVTF